MAEPYWVKSRKRYAIQIEAGWTPRGTRRRIVVYGVTKRECLAKARAKQRELDTVGAPEESTRAGMTVKAWAEVWLERQERELRPSAYNATRSQMRQWVIPTIGHKRLDRLAPADVRAVSSAMDRAGLATSSIRRAHGELVRMLGDAYKDGHQVPERSRLTEFGRRKRVVKSSRSDFAPDEARALMRTLESRDDRARWLLALVAAMRPAEVRGLTWKCVDLDAGVVTAAWQLQPLPYKIPGDRSSGFRVPRDFEAIHLHDAFHLVRPKTAHGERVVPLTPTVVDALRRWREIAPESPYDLVFCRPNGRALDDKRDREAWWALLDLAGLDRRPLYDARHQALSRLSEHATDVELTSVAGHASIASTRPYQHAQLERARAAMIAAEQSMRAPS